MTKRREAECKLQFGSCGGLALVGTAVAVLIAVFANPWTGSARAAPRQPNQPGLRTLRTSNIWSGTQPGPAVQALTVDFPAHALEEFKELSENNFDEAVTRFLVGDLLTRVDETLVSPAAQERMEVGCALVRSAEHINNELSAKVAYMCEEQMGLFKSAREGQVAVGEQSHFAIERKKAMSYEAFYQHFWDIEHPKPLIITDQTLLDSEQWTLRRIAELCGNVTVGLRTSNVAEKQQVTSHNQSRKTTLRSFLSQVSQETLTQPLYLFDWSMQQECEALLKEDRLKIPKYIAQDLLQALPSGISVTTQWPSLLIGPAGSGSSLHTDSLATHFWMYLVSGKKRWRVHRRKDQGMLYLNAFTEEFAVKDVWNATAADFPYLGSASYWDFELNAGELLLIPYDFPHQVENLETTVAIAGNWVDTKNWKAMLQQAKKMDLFTSGEGIGGSNQILPFVESVLGAGKQPMWPPKIRKGQQDVSWEEYKGQYG